MKTISLIRGKYFFVSLLFLMAVGCVNLDDYAVIHPPQYDHLIGKKFDDVIYLGRKKGLYQVVREASGIEELTSPGRKDCILIFGVNKVDDVIKYWRVDSAPGSCLERKKSLGV
jgi:hypothetical protein